MIWRPCNSSQSNIFGKSTKRKNKNQTNRKNDKKNFLDKITPQWLFLWESHKTRNLPGEMEEPLNQSDNEEDHGKTKTRYTKNTEQG